MDFLLFLLLLFRFQKTFPRRRWSPWVSSFLEKKCKLTGHEYTMSSLQQLHVQLHYDGAAFTVNPGSAVADSL